jgi:DNA modification methylase
MGHAAGSTSDASAPLTRVIPGPEGTAGEQQSRILVGDAEKVLAGLPTGIFQCCVTSPPYWGLRDYGSPDQLGGEEQLEDYLARLLAVFAQVHRVLRDDGTLWLNLGDGYTSGGRTRRAPDKKNPARAMDWRPPTPAGLKPKDLLGVPWRLALALQAAGWYLRADIVWHKPNAQPESVRDRPSRAHEYLFLLSKHERYRYHGAAAQPTGRTVWSIPTQGYPGAHFATFPPALVEPCLLAGTVPGDLVLDPFFGAGTTGLVAQALGRRCVGIELNPEYAELARQRLTVQSRI